MTIIIIIDEEESGKFVSSSSFLQLSSSSPTISRFVMSFLMRFPHDEDTVYLAHCYPYRYSDMMLDLEKLMADPARAAFIKKEILCQVKPHTLGIN